MESGSTVSWCWKAYPPSFWIWYWGWKWEHFLSEIASLFSFKWLHLPGICISKTLLSAVPLTTFQTRRNPSDHDGFSTTPNLNPSLLYARYAYHSIKGNLSSFQAVLISQYSNLPFVLQLSASFAPVKDSCWVRELLQIRQRSTVYLTIFSRAVKSEFVFAHSNRGKGVMSLASSQTCNPKSQPSGPAMPRGATA